MTTYYIDFSSRLVLDDCFSALPVFSSPAGSWPANTITWRRLKQVDVWVEGDLIVERWLCVDSEVDPMYEGKLVEPVLKQDHDYQTQVTKHYVAGVKYLGEMPAPSRLIKATNLDGVLE